MVRDDRAGLALRADEQMRRAAAFSTRHVALRWGSSLPMWVGCGFPKSGTVWLCQLMAAYLGVPYPRDYKMPIVMPSVVHAHWAYDRRFPPAAYIRRDGRDVMVSMYFYYVRAMRMQKSPNRVRQLSRRFEKLFGATFDPQQVRGNLPRFIEYEMQHPRATDAQAWHVHVADWWDRPRVHHTQYEALLADSEAELGRLMSQLTGEPANPTHVRSAVQRFAFGAQTGRRSGQEDRSSFLRKGVAGEWRDHFSREAGEIFDALTGSALVDFGYEKDRSWFTTLRP